MESLASRIRREFRTANHYAVYEEDLSRIWPVSDIESARQKLNGLLRNMTFDSAFIIPAFAQSRSRLALRLRQAVQAVALNLVL